MRLSKLALTTIAFVITAAPVEAQPVRLLRALSGPSGKVDGSRFLLDEVRSRFVHPQDKSFIVSFEWETQPGVHVLVASWKRPDGAVDSLSPEVKIDSKDSRLSCYWTYLIQPDMPPGVWSIEVRVDGQPAGSHPFEIVGTSPPGPASPAPVPEEHPTLDHLFRAISPSLVSIRRINHAGNRMDSALGFAISDGRVVTAFQAIDGADRLEIQLAGGRKIETDEVVRCSRMGDWAVLAAKGIDAPPLVLDQSVAMPVGARAIVFQAEGDAPTIGGVDISGRRASREFGERIQFTPALSMASAGGPLLDRDGKVAGVLGGSLAPGARFPAAQMSMSPALGIAPQNITAATPVSAILNTPEKPATLSQLQSTGVLTPPLSEMEGLLYVSTTRELPKSATDPLPRDVAEFGRSDKQVSVLSEWVKRGKVSKGMLSAKVYDAHNRLRVQVAPRKTSLALSATRSGFSFSPAQLDPGLYRIDLIWDDQPVWRAFIRITE